MVNTTIILYILCSPRWRSSTESAETRHGADGSSGHQLLTVSAPYFLKLKKLGETDRPFRYGLDQIPYDYTVEVTNRFKELYRMSRVPEELWMEVGNTV